MLPGSDIVRRDSIEELCGHRARALQLYRQALDTMNAAKAAHALACAGSTHISTDFLREFRYQHIGERFDRDVRAGVDRDMWRFFIVGTPLGSLMDRDEHRRFNDGLQKEVPEITPETVFLTMAKLAGDAGPIFRRGLVNAFAGFCDGYKSHDGFKIGPRFVMDCLITGKKPYFFFNHHRDDIIRDIDRCMHVLDGKPTPDYQQGVAAAIRAEIAGNKGPEVTTEYFRVRIFYGNGNAHFYPLRQDLVDAANKLIAQHYGEVLGAGPAARAA